MPTFGVIDTSATGDTYYEGFVKDAANWALVEAGLSVVNGGTGRVTSTTAYGLVAAGTTATGAHQTLAAGLTTQILVGGGASALPAWGTDIPTAVTIGTAYIYRVGGTDVTVADGGTGASTLTDHGILLGSGTSAVTPLGEATHGQIPIGSTGADPVLATITGTAGQVAVTNAAGSITLGFSTTIQIPENVPVLHDAALSADGKYSALEAIAGTLGETVAFGEAVYFKAADSRWWKTNATVTATSGAVRVGICLVAGDAAGATTIMFKGTIRADALFDTFTVSAPVFLSAATAGKIVSAAPTGTTDFVVRIVGHALDANTVHVNVSNEYIELA